MCAAVATTVISTGTGCISGWVERTSASALRFTSIALHELNLGAVKIDVVFTINRALGNVQFACENHLAGGKKRRRRLINEPGLDEKPETDRQNRNPPAPEEQRFVAVQPGNKCSGPGSGDWPFRATGVCIPTC